MSDKGFHGSPGPVMRQKAKGTRPQRNKARMMARRHVLPGYPVDPKPFTLEEIREYFSGDRITCLLCGKPYKRLALHLPRCHSVTEDDYRKMYGLPWRRGLTSEGSHKAYSAAAIKRKSGDLLKALGHEWRYKAHSAARNQRKQPFVKEISRENIAIANETPTEGYPDSMFGKVIEQIALGKTIVEISEMDGLPSASWIGEFKRQNKWAKKLYEKTIDGLPYDMQAKMESLGPSFWKEVEVLRGKGLSDHKISDATGISAMAINRGRRKRSIA